MPNSWLSSPSQPALWDGVPTRPRYLDCVKHMHLKIFFPQIFYTKEILYTKLFVQKLCYVKILRNKPANPVVEPVHVF